MCAVKQAHHEVEKFYFSVFTKGEDHLSKKGEPIKSLTLSLTTQCLQNLYPSSVVLTQLVRVAATFAITTGTDLHEEAVITEDHPIILSLVSSAVRHHQSLSLLFTCCHVLQMLMGDQSTGELTLTQFTVWVGEHCPHLLEGLQQWIMSLLKSRQATHHSVSDRPNLTPSVYS